MIMTPRQVKAIKRIDETVGRKTLAESIRGDIVKAIYGWRQAEQWDLKRGNTNSAEVCASAAESLEIELKTGVAICPCCFVPSDVRRPGS